MRVVGVTQAPQKYSTVSAGMSSQKEQFHITVSQSLSHPVSDLHVLEHIWKKQRHLGCGRIKDRHNKYGNLIKEKKKTKPTT